MALDQRPAAHFFATFHRWSCSAQRAIPCIHSARLGFVRYRFPRSARVYHATGRLRWNDGSHAQLKDQAVLPNQYQDQEAEEELASSREAATVGTEACTAEQELAQQHVPSTAEGTLQDGGQQQEHLPRVTSETRRATPHEAYTMAEVETQALQKGVRSLMRHVPSSVAILTVASSDPASKASVPIGTAISSLSTVTLDPPHVSFNVKNPSKTLEAVRAANGLFRVHFLSCRRKSGLIVESFTRGNTPEAFKLRHHLTPIHLFVNRSDTESTDSLAPQIRSDAVVAAMECQIVQELVVQDHIIAVAKVNGMETVPELESTLLYHDGMYKRNDGTVLHKHGSSVVPIEATNNHAGMYWEYPLFPGEAEKKDFMLRVKELIKTQPHYLNGDPQTVAKGIQTALGIPYGPFGLNLPQLVAECKVESGLDSGLEAISSKSPVTTEFFGRLSPGSIATISERANKLVRANPMALSTDYRTFYNLIGISIDVQNLLASDILTPLRAEGLVTQVEVRATSRNKDPHFKHMIEDLEDVEHKLRTYMKITPYEKTYRMSTEELQHAIKETDWLSSYIKQVRGRITAEAYPDLFSLSRIDISGDLTIEEVRVVIARIIPFLIVGHSKSFRKQISMPKSEILRRIGVHPAVSGVDIEFLFGKLLYMLHNLKSFRDFPEAVDQMLKPLFKKRILSWSEVQKRVRDLVRKHTLSVIRWSREDLMAAMGIDHRAKFKTPLSSNRPHLLHGHTLPTLFADALRSRYGKGTLEENDSIASHLKSRYNFDVAALPSSDSRLPSQASDETRGSDEDMQDAMMRSLNVHVIHSDKARHELEKALETFRGRAKVVRKIWQHTKDPETRVIGGTKKYRRVQGKG